MQNPGPSPITKATPSWVSRGAAAGYRGATIGDFPIRCKALLDDPTGAYANTQTTLKRLQSAALGVCPERALGRHVLRRHVRHTSFQMAGLHHYVVWRRGSSAGSATCALANSHPEAEGRNPPHLPMSSPISRLAALRVIAGATALATLSRSRAADAAAKSTPATPPTSNPLRQSACKWCWPKIDLDAFCGAGKEMGLVAIDLLQPEDFPTLKKHGLLCSMVSNPTAKTPQGVNVGGIGKAFNRLEHHDTLVEIYTKRIAEVADAGFTNLICFSGNREKMDDQQGLQNCAVGLKRLLSIAEKRGVTLVMELLNSKVNHKDYMCDHTAWGVELCKQIGSERFKLLYDIYHMQIMEGDVIRTVKDNAAYIGHYHTAGNPGRNEFESQDQQELNYPAIMRAIKSTGYKGFVGQEFLPKRDALTSLREAVKLCNV